MGRPWADPDTRDGGAGGAGHTGRYRIDPPRGYAGAYARWTAWWRAAPERGAALVWVCRALKYACYAAYPLLLVLVWARCGLSVELVRNVAVPAFGFALVTMMRVVLSEPRPYEAYAIDQLVPKDTRGKSFPSRHVYSIFVIGMCWLRLCAPAGLAVLAAGCVMAAARVLGGVHYPRDVVAGAALGVACGAALWWLA